MICICGTPLPAGKLTCPYCRKVNNVASDSTVNPGMVRLTEVKESENRFISTGPWDACFGTDYRTKKQGIAVGSVVLLGGMPGAGKSTLALQLSDAIAKSLGRKVIYIAAEEDLLAVRARAERLRLQAQHNIFGISALGGGNIDMYTLLLKEEPCAVVVDSLAGLSLESLNAEVEYSKAMKHYAVRLQAPIILINHATKQDDLAGLLALQHAVDTTLVLYVNDDEEESRTLTVLKNRYGPSNVEVSLLMTENGLVELEIPDEAG